MVQRPDRHESFLAQAAVIADRSTCLRRHIGAILVDPRGHQISSGYNGAPTGQPHCATCLREERGIRPGQHYERCRSVHGEDNALQQAGRAAVGATLYLVSKDAKTGTVIFQIPCYMCAKKILNAGVSCIVILAKADAAHPYETVNPTDVYRSRDTEIWERI